MMDQPSRAVAAEEVFQQAMALHKQGKLTQAEKLYRAILSGDGDHLGALHNLGILCFQRGDYDGAVAFTRDVIRRRPDSPTAYNTLAIVLKRFGRLPKSAAAKPCASSRGMRLSSITSSSPCACSKRSVR
jgi:Flp pilus assembly protein TadD